MYTLVRERDGLVNQSKDILFLEFHDSGIFKSEHKDIKVGRALLMSPFNQWFTWQTTLITEILEKSENYWKFKTENSTYTLTKDEVVN